MMVRYVTYDLHGFYYLFLKIFIFSADFTNDSLHNKIQKFVIVNFFGL